MADADVIPIGGRRGPATASGPTARESDAELEASADDLGDSIADAAKEAFGEPVWQQRLTEALHVLRRRLCGDYEVDEFGFDAEVADACSSQPFARLQRSGFGSRSGRSRTSPATAAR